VKRSSIYSRQSRRLPASPVAAEDEFELARATVRAVAPEIDSRDAAAVWAWWHGNANSANARRIKAGWE